MFSGGKDEGPPPAYIEAVNGANCPSLSHNLKQTEESSQNGAVGGEENHESQNEIHNYPLHECVYRGDVKQLSALIRAGNDLGKVDPHGNSALHLAVMLGRTDCVHLLCAHGAPVKIKNKQGWSPIAEAISYGNRQTIASLLRKLKQQSRDKMKSRKAEMIESLKKLGDFVVDLKWDFNSWLPLVSRILPSDICKISKKGASIRLDTTLVDFTEMRWERGDITFLYRGDAASPEESLYVLDNELRVYQKVRYEESELEFEDEVDLLMSSDIVSAQISTKPITFTRVQTGWFFKEDRQEMIGNYNANFYSINGMVLETRKRREHLTKEDLQKNKALLENFATGNTQYLEEQNGSEAARKNSLAPPATPKVPWQTYIEAPPGEPACLGREHICKESRKTFKATVAMSEDFPLTVEMLLSVLEVIAPQFKHFQKLRDFIELKLPPGFPVKVDIPVLPTVSARVTFHDFAWKNLNDYPENAQVIQDTSTSKNTEEGCKSTTDSSEQKVAAVGGVHSNKVGEKSSSCSNNDASSENILGLETDIKNEETKLHLKEDNDVDGDTGSEKSVADTHLDDSLFEIPAGYVEDNTRFPDL